jgi:hypothetical protein
VAGVYNIPALPPGTYRVSVARAGFKTIVRDNIVVDVGNVVGLDIKLELGSTVQTVTVEAAAPVLKTEQSSTSSEVPVEAYMDLPLTASGGRSPLGFTSLVPGVNAGNSINGAPQGSGLITMDGVTVQTGFLPGDTGEVRMPPEAIGEMSIVTTNYAAEYGQTEGGVQRFEIKSGTNTYHGNVYEFNRNTIYNARGFFNTVTPKDIENEYGFSLGGPVSIPHVYNGKDRSFFFWSADWYRTAQHGALNILTLPNDAFRRGDFSGNLGAPTGLINPCDGTPILSGQIFDPTTTRVVNGQECRTAFPGNIIPPGEITLPSQKILSYVPHTTNQNIVNNTDWIAYGTSSYLANYQLKGDQYFGTKHHLSMMWEDAVTVYAGGGIFPAPIDNWGGTYAPAFDFARLTDDWMIMPNLMNEIRLGYNRELNPYYALPNSYADSAWRTNLGIPGFETASGLFPDINWGQYYSLAGLQWWYGTNQMPIIQDSLTWTKGRHNFKFGGEYDWGMNSLWKDWPVLWNFGRGETGAPTALGSTGNEAASFELGLVDNAQIPQEGNTSATYYFPRTLDLYAQDDYKVTPRLTINYGLRYARYEPLYEWHNIYSMVDLNTPNPSAGNLPGTYLFAGVNGVGKYLPNANKGSNTWGPRLGLAYKLTNRLVLRGGYGISYFVSGVQGAGNNVWLTDGYDPTSTAISPDAGITPGMTFAEGFPASDLQKVNLTSSYAIGSVFKYWAPSYAEIPQMQSWNATVQTRLTPNMSLEVAYVGTKGTYLPIPENLNQLSDQYLPLGATLLDSSINDPAVVAAGYTPPWPGFATALGAHATLAQALRPYPQYLTGWSTNSADRGNSTYHALQVKLERRMSNGIYLLSSFVWSKSITDANTTELANPNNNPAGAGTVTDQGYLNLAKCVAAAWQPLRWTTSAIYELPFGPGKKFLTSGGVLGRVVDGWRLSGILTYTSGGLISVGAANPLPNFSGPNFANTVLGVPQKGSWSGKFDPQVDTWLNVNAFSVPTGYGTEGMYLPNLFGPRYADEDISLSKNTKIKERLNLEMRLEAFNVFNRVVFGLPASTVGYPASFGVITTQGNSPRNMQVALKLNF